MFKAEEVFFFDQNNPKIFETRRARKLLDDIYSISGDRREGVTIRLGEKEVADSASVVTAHSLGRKISVVGYGVRLPQIDPQGPNFIRGNQSIAEENREVETKSILSEKRFELLKEVEEELSTTKQEAAHKPASIWEVSEAKFASSGILSKLGKLLEDVCTKVIEVTLPADLLEDLSRNYKELTADVVVEKREWQTDCYDDYRSNNAFPFLTGPPDKLQQQVNKSALKNLVAHQEQVKRSRKIFGRKDNNNNNSSNFKTEKRVRMSREAKGDGRSVEFKTTPTPERPQTARSNISSYSYRLDCSDDGRDSYMATEYDRLPPELRPTILHYRRESTSLKMNKPLTRMEKAQEVKKKNAAERFRNVRSTSPGRKVSMSARPRSARPGAGEDFIGGTQIPKTVIAFSIAGAHQSNEDNQAWLVHPSDTANPEAHTLRMWDKKLKELHRTMEEAKHLDKERC